MDEHVEQQKKKFQVDKWASKRARLLFTTSCRHPEIVFLHRMLILWIRPIHLFVTAKRVVGLDVTVMFNLGFV